MFQKENLKQPAFLVAGVLFTLIALVSLAALLVLKSKADSALQEVNTGSADPVFDSIIVSDASRSGDIGPAGSGTGFTPNEGTTKTIYVRGQVTEQNGCNDLKDIVVTVYNSGALEQAACTPDMNDCYRKTLLPADLDPGCGVGVNTVTFETSFLVANFVNPTDAGSPYGPDGDDTVWLANGRATDNGDLSGEYSALSADFTVNSMAAFSVPNAINYGALGLGAVSNPVTLTFTNTGNRDVDADVIASTQAPLIGDMTSSLSGFANIAASAVNYSTVSDFEYGDPDATAVSKDDSTDLALNLVQQTEDSTPTQVDSFWRMQMPTSGVNGTYSNVLVFTAKTSSGGGGMCNNNRICEPPRETVLNCPSDCTGGQQGEGFTPLGSIDLSAGGDNQLGTITQVGNTSYVMNLNDTVLTSIDSTNIASPVVISSVNSDPVNNYAASAMVVNNGYAYIVTGAFNSNFKIVDVSDPADMTVSSALTAVSGGGLQDVAVTSDGNHAVILLQSATSNNFRIIDTTNKTSPSVVGGSTMTIPEYTWHVEIRGNYAYVYSFNYTVGEGYITVVDISTPSSPTVAGTYTTTMRNSADFLLSNDGNYAILVGSNGANSVEIVSISNPSSMSLVKSISINGNYVTDAAVVGTKLYVSDSQEGVATNITTIDFGIPANASVVDSVNVSTLGKRYWLSADASYIYLSGQDNGLYNTMSSALSPHIGSLSQTTSQSGTLPFTLIVNGTGFTANSVVKWDTTSVGTVYIGPTEIEALLTSDQLNPVGTFDITVHDTTTLKTSNALQYEVTPAM
ncbi:MAG: hypothetical protein WC551_03885 [Patescibacteria group bacterium]